MGRRLSRQDYSGILDSMHRRVSGWQGRSLSAMGRVVLIRTVLTSIPTYLLTNSLVPVAVIREMDRLCCSFLWQSSRERTGVHLLAWESVCQPLALGGLGISSLMERRDLLWYRQSARLLLSTDSLWTSTMRRRYPFLVEEGMGCLQGRISSTGRQIRLRLPAIRPHLFWVVGDGKSIFILRSAWLSDIPIIRWPTFISVELDWEARVADLLEPEGSWRADRVLQVGGSILGARILAVAAPRHPCPDRCCWDSSLPGLPPSRSFCPLLGHCRRTSRALRWIWRLGIQPRVSLFLWKLAWGRLPTRALLSSRGFGVEPFCAVCPGVVETLDHALFSCSRAEGVWRLARASAFLPPGISSVSALLGRLSSSRSRSTPCFVGYLAYGIWLSRNDVIFAARFRPYRLIFERAILLAREAHRSSLAESDFWGSSAARRARRTVFFSWEPPPPTFVKVNFDASLSPAGSGAGYIIRDPDGRLLLAGGVPLHSTSVPLLELRAAWEGLRAAILTLGAQSIIVEGDSSTVIGWIRQACASSSGLPVLYDISRFLAGALSVSVQHVYREANSAADWMASFVAFHRVSVCWDDTFVLPAPLRDLLLADRQGRLFSRAV